jgi:hypothetical protein
MNFTVFGPKMEKWTLVINCSFSSYLSLNYIDLHCIWVHFIFKMLISIVNSSFVFVKSFFDKFAFVIAFVTVVSASVAIASVVIKFITFVIKLIIPFIIPFNVKFTFM